MLICFFVAQNQLISRIVYGKKKCFRFQNFKYRKCTVFVHMICRIIMHWEEIVNWIKIWYRLLQQILEMCRSVCVAFKYSCMMRFFLYKTYILLNNNNCFGLTLKPITIVIIIIIYRLAAKCFVFLILILKWLNIWFVFFPVVII